MTVENILRSISTKECCRPRRVLNPRPPGLQSDGASNWATEAEKLERYQYFTDEKSAKSGAMIWTSQLIRSLQHARTASAWIFVLSDQFLISCNAVSRQPDQTAWMYKVIWKFAVLMIWLNWYVFWHHILCLQKKKQQKKHISATYHIYMNKFGKKNLICFILTWPITSPCANHSGTKLSVSTCSTLHATWFDLLHDYVPKKCNHSHLHMYPKDIFKFVINYKCVDGQVVWHYPHYFFSFFLITSVVCELWILQNNIWYL